MLVGQMLLDEKFVGEKDAVTSPGTQQAGTDTVPGNTSSTASVAIGGSQSGAINTLGDHDWYRVNLTAGETYVFDLVGTPYGGYAAVPDTYLYLRDSNGNLLALDDDGGAGLYSRLTFTAPSNGTYFLDVAAFGDSYTGGYELSAGLAQTSPTYTLDQIAYQLTDGYWLSESVTPSSWGTSTISVNIDALDNDAQQLAIDALAVWETAANLTFTFTSGSADITFDDEVGFTAYAGWGGFGNTITIAEVHIGREWVAFYGAQTDSYAFQTYVHEIGHALGLGHGGNYNGSATYGIDNHYANDTWSYTIMSYFDQNEAGFGSARFVMGLGLADYVAIANLYGANTTTNSGNTTYGFNATDAGGLTDFTAYTATPAFTIYDTSGSSDTLDASLYTWNQTIDLDQQAFSSIGGLVNNISIARGTVIENAFGGLGSDTILGNAANNDLRGGGGIDFIYGELGNDRLRGGANGDWLDGGDGIDWADYVDSGAGVTVNLSTGNHSGGDAQGDILVSIERVFGSAYADSLTGDAAANFLRGGAGGDSLSGAEGNDFLQGDAGADALNGGAGSDWAYYTGAASGVTVNLDNAALNTGEATGDTFTSIENIYGSFHNDDLTGNNTVNTLRGWFGDDILRGGDSVDYLQGDDGADQHFGGDGNDWAYYVAATAGVTVNFSNVAANTGEAAGDTYDSVEYLRGSSFADTLTGDSGSNYIRGGNGNDTLNGEGDVDFLAGELGADVLNGGAGVDWAYYRFSTVAVTVDLGANFGLGGEAQGDTYSSIENVYGSAYDDLITGDGGNNLLRGQSGNDTLNGGSGNDYLTGDAGADVMDGGSGSDWVYYTTATTVVTVNLTDSTQNAGAHAVGDSYVSIENIYGGGGGDTLIGDSNANTIRGYAGNDTIQGLDGNDILYGDQGADSIDGGAGVDWAYYTSSTAGVTIDLGANTATGGDAQGDTFTSIERIFGSAHDDTITGDANANYLRGWSGADQLNGADGNDFLDGGASGDVLNGGSGSDWAYYTGAAAGQTINLANASLNAGSEATGDTYISIENVFGSIHADDITGDSGANSLRGFLGDDILEGGAGNDLLRGEAGADTFHFILGTGTDTVDDFNAGEDVLLFENYGFATSAAVIAAASQSGANVEIVSGGDTIIVEDTLVSALTALNVQVA